MIPGEKRVYSVCICSLSVVYVCDGTDAVHSHALSFAVALEEMLGYPYVGVCTTR